ncbi:hypothetical protein ACHAXA_003152 [Cyclostephanos tholiformis]|uniref:dCMP deaminase n=1 Tax=Cyclostephanos tholiformis TaxID=382380 RepID=A0ABD3ST43_9STRA
MPYLPRGAILSSTLLLVGAIAITSSSSPSSSSSSSSSFSSSIHRQTTTTAKVDINNADSSNLSSRPLTPTTKRRSMMSESMITKMTNDREEDIDSTEVDTNNATMTTKASTKTTRPVDDGDDEKCRRSSSSSTNAEERRIRDLVHSESRGYDLHSPNNIEKRGDYLSWDDYFLAVACLSARRSKDPTVGGRGWRLGGGACVVDVVGRIVGIGYDGFPRGCSDDCLPWASASCGAREGGEGSSSPLPWLETKEPYLCRAEINAILNKCSSDVVGGRMYVPNFPSNECAKFIIQSGIREIRYVDDEDPDSDSSRASRILFELAGVKMTKITPGVSSIRIDFCSPCDDTDVGAMGGSKPGRDVVEMEKYLGLLRREASMDPFEYGVTRRMDYLSWDEYFMGVAFLSGHRSKDPMTQVGACLVDADKCIVGIGYNGFPRGCSDDVLPWARSAQDELHKKYPYVVHAEVNAILNKCSASVRGATLYVALFPCNECAKVIIQSGIREVVYLNDHYHDTDACRASRIMFEMAGVNLRRYQPECQKIVIDF